MALILLIALGFALAMFPTLRCAVFHPVSLVRFGVMDLLDHFKHHEYDRCGSGELVAYTGLFGKGKTLSAVHIPLLYRPAVRPRGRAAPPGDKLRGGV